MKRNQENGNIMLKSCSMKKSKCKQPCTDDEVEICDDLSEMEVAPIFLRTNKALMIGLAGREAGLGDFGVSITKGEDLSLIPVSPGESGLGRPYAPENWPEPGDMWRWKVGKRGYQSSGFKDRYLCLPERLQKLLSRKMCFNSKSSLNSFLESQFPGIDTSAFFASFIWRIPAKVLFTTASKGLAGQEAGLGNFGVSIPKGEALSLIPVSPGDSGLGRPYAPENWPEPGDMWRWKVGKRSYQSCFRDRYLYLPERLQKLFPPNMPFDSKTSLISFLESQSPGIDTSAFFASFVWRIPTKVPFTTASKGESFAKTINSCIMQHKRAYTTRSLNATLGNYEVTIASSPHCYGESRTRLKCNNSETQERGELSNFKFGHYMEIIWNLLPEEKKKYFTYLDPSNFLLYGNEARKGDVVGWIKKRNVTSKRYVIIPSVEGNHWRLFIVCHSDETIEPGKKIECLLLLDSLQARQSRYHFEDRLRRLIADVYGMPENGEEINKIPLMVPKVPQQTNGRDCGFFVLYYIKLFIKNAPENFSISSFPYFMTKNWFCPEQVERFINTLDQHDDASSSEEEFTDVSVGSAIELIQLTDTGTSNAHGLS